MEKGTGSYRHEKEPSRFIEMKTVQWYPGHMAKAMRMLEENLNLVDAVLLVLDARAPLSSYNPRLEKLVKNKPVLFVFNKRDLADPKSDEIGEALRKRMDEHPREDAWVALEYVLECYRPSGFFITEEYAVKLAYRMARRGL